MLGMSLIRNPFFQLKLDTGLTLPTARKELALALRLTEFMLDDILQTVEFAVTH